ncbi:kinase-like protein [Macrolepiota fuliginosa MF-IS2]|uniref:Kinase-like protein n=1 Tax=Macrolepiota fuliginosa MF-IS2 TaxID=1400762 RepID=A0A9P6BYA3_9AGAR|nr:kinase-like protein [Macrolepiota fuliginosa MF-IS2]
MQAHPTRIPTQIDQLSYNDLKGRIGFDKTAPHANHSGDRTDVFVGYLTNTDNTKVKVAIKVLRMTNDEEAVTNLTKYLTRETVAWHRLNHPNILKFFGLDSSLGQFGCPALISPYCDNGTVNNYLKSHSDINTRLFIIKGVSEGLQHLHQQEVVHGNINPSNVLIHDDGYPLLCGFGRSEILAAGGFTTKPGGACRYQPPELLQGGSPNKTTDVYGFAVTSYEIWTGSQPFHEIDQYSSIILSIVMKDARPEYPEHAPSGTDALWELFEDCWKGIPEERLDIEVVVRRLGAINIPQ